jgi:hypothetical protein
MPSRTLTPDPLAASGQHAPPEPPASGQHAPPEPPAFSGLRLITVPAGWPPYDCETHGAACPAAREAATTHPHVNSQAPECAGPPRAVAPSPAPSAPSASGQDRTPSAPASTGPTGAAAWGGTATRAGTAPDAVGQAGASHAGASQAGASQAGAGQTVPLPRQFAQVIVEILAGSRPLRQAVGWTTDRVRAQIGDLTQVLTSDQRPRIRRIVTSQPTASVVEMTVVVNFGQRSRALAMRFEHMPARRPAPGLPARPARWLCTEIETG